jgi:hypothetical protein
MPKAVAQALQSKYAKATYKTVEEVIKLKDGKEKLKFYEIKLTAGKKTLEVAVTPEGKVSKEEDKTKKQD